MAATLAGLVMASVAHWLIAEIVVKYEMWATNAQSREELADDFGLAALWMIVVLPGTAVLSVMAALVAWIMLRKPDRADSGKRLGGNNS